ncbi:serine hydrolase [Streptomyces sp. TRM76323]|uniref:Serine hydrolase n=1 Tax=Streptomyces tamarix TaxID=3078565 RepID=A0ABU3QRB3_9ACTN|nr:serine hydrolase [Streptomyces tamarix]MDT9685313.1 serine hydrolase [Streptomyces tamarix]
MAGESPDKSEQRRSPGERAAGGRDPRLAVGDATPAGVDQPTAVFKAPKPTAETTEPRPAKPSLIAQRQEAVTAEPVETSEESDPEPATPADGPSTSDEPDGPSSADEAGASDGAGASGVTDASSGEDGASGPSGVTAVPGPSRASGDSDDDSDNDSDGSGAGETPDEDEVEGEGETDPAAEGGRDDAASPVSGARGDAGAPEAAGADAAGKLRTASGTTAGSRAAKASGAGTSDVSEPTRDSGTDAAEEPESGTKPGSRAETESGAKSESKTEAESGAGAKPEAGAEAGSGAKPEAGSGAGPVDQPTAVFKAPGKRDGAAPAVDQPTTALKALPSGAEGKPVDGKPAPKWAAGADGDGERPGTFVPLRSDDVRPAAAATRTAKTGGTASARATATAAATAAAAGTGSRTASAEAADTALDDAEMTAAVTPPSLTEAERTKQQPMPPRPPLDLLAELTNTPPPPDTPVRTLVRRVKIWTPLVVLLLIVFATVQLLRPLPDPSLTLSADATYTFEGGRLKMPWPTEGQGAVEVEGVGVVGTYGPQTPAPTASVAKVMTAYVILRDHPIKDKDSGPKIEIDQKTEDQASNPDWSTAPVEKGQRYTQGELLQLLMVRSANNVAHLLARWDAGSEEAFIKKMNATAEDLGMTGTVYTDASGFDKGTVSTPKDQLKLAKAAMRSDVFREIVDMPNLNLPQIGRQLENGNTILLKDGVNGIKTGTSTPAGGNLLWSANTVVDGEVRRVIGVVMNVKSGVTLSERTKLAVETYSYGLIKAAQDGVVSATAVKKGDVVGYVDDGLGGRTPVVATKDLKPVGWAGLEVELKLTEGKDGKGGVPGAAAEGTVVGELAVGSGEGRVGVPVALQRDLEEPGFGAKLTRIG